LAATAQPLARSSTALGHLPAEARAGLLILLPIVVLGLLVPAFGPYDPTSTAGAPLTPPGLTHPLGTDDLGRDVLSRTLAAARADLVMALIGVSVPLCIGTLIGGVLGTTRSSAVSVAWMVVIEGINSFPTIVLVIAVVAVVGPGIQGVLIGLAMTNW